MNLDSIIIGLDTFEVVGLLLALVLVAGIVWRVEMKLDRSYKCLFAALSFLTLAEILEKIFSETKILVVVSSGFRTLFVLSLLIGLWMMRDLVRTLDGEKTSDNSEDVSLS